MSFTNADEFRAALTAFGDKEVFPSPDIDFWRALGLKLHNADRYGDFLDEALMFFVAHNLALEFNSKNSAKIGQAPGQVLGAITSTTVDKVSYSRDPGSSMDPKNGHWNLTIYGLRWLMLQRYAGAGPVQIGASADTSYSASAGAWPGPFPYGR